MKSLKVWVKCKSKQCTVFDSAGLEKRFKEIERDVVDIQEMFKELKNYIDTYIHSEKLSSAVAEISDKIKSITEKL